MEKNLPKRNEVPQEMTWRLGDIYENEEAWEAERAQILPLAEEIAGYDGKVAGSADILLKVLQLFEKGVLLIDRVMGYAHMYQDQDTSDTTGQSLEMKGMNTIAQAMEKISFLDPEILEIPEDTLKEFFAKEPGLEHFACHIREIRRLREHTLSKETEALIASARELMGSPQGTYGMLSNADLKFPTVKDRDGNEIQITNGRFVPLQMSPDRSLRKAVFEQYYARWKEFSNTWASLYDGEVKARIFESRARKYGSCFEAAVDGNNVSPAVCDNLFDSVHRNIGQMHRYVRLRKKLLGVEELHMYDIYASMVSDFEMKVSYEEAKAMTLEALKPMGEEYLSVVRRAYEERWIDVMENEGKRSGAYSSGVYDVHPYMLLNYNNTLDDVFTLIHEMGHSMHTWYSTHAQSLLDSEYKIFVAEVASTTNEILLLEYLLGKAESKQEKAYLINHLLESFKGTLFRQTMFEEFERKTCAMAEEGTPLTAETLADVYLNLNREYFGEDMVSDPEIAWEWCRIPHFYYNFYVYQYATSFSAAVAIARRILKEGESYAKQYIEFLKSGCTQDPVSLLKIAGIDLSTAQPIDSALEEFARAITEMEELYA